ncbi:hypothetical protein D3C81_1508800 [compost metagenome]
MPRAAGAAQAFGQRRYADTGLHAHAVGVHLFDRGREQQIAACLEQALLVGSERARVGVKVFVGAELQRVDEDTGDHEVGTLGGLGHQRGMAVVQVAHGRHERNAFAFATSTGHGGTQLSDGLDCVHALNPCSLAGKLASLTAVT